ncbi:MAG: DUF2196 domain-containing protein [Gammaproteobacteria bacterium]|nr:DUF2196 domain-containing protein [Gammaproteobacteria bacterium]
MKPGDITRDTLSVGCSVLISTRSRKDRHLIKGLVSEILTSSNTHPHGILVRLESGEEGRVQELVGREESAKTDPRMSALEGPVNNSQLQGLITSGENHFIEYKESLLWSQDLTQDELNSVSNETKRYGRDSSKIIVAKVISSFLNSDGGTLIIGLREDKELTKNQIVGIEKEYVKLKDKCEDGYRRILLDGVLKAYFPEFVFNRFSDYFRIDFHKVLDKTLCIIEVSRADAPVFIQIRKDKLFFIRVDASVRQLQDESILTYCHSRYPVRQS